MPNKKKRLFTKHNSTKFVLYTEGRDAEGNKITENVLVPVSSNHVPGDSLLLSHITELCGPSRAEQEMIGKIVSKSTKQKPKSKSADNSGPDLEGILHQMEDFSEDENEYEIAKSRLKDLNIFGDLKKSGYPHPNVHVEITEEGSDFSDELGQFSDAESDIDSSDLCPEYSLTSSKTDCPESVKILNEGFEKIFEEYDDDQIGALDDEDICGVFSTENEQIKNFIQTPFEKEEKDVKIGEFDEDIKEKILKYIELDEPEKFVEITIEKPLDFDCESILSTYSNKYNHPVVIKEESKIKKITIPSNPLQKKLTKSKLKQLDSDSESDEEFDKMTTATSCNIRTKDETPEQKRERKNLFKEAKRERRALKKENKLAFKYEKIRQTSQNMNARHISGIRLV